MQIAQQRLSIADFRRLGALQIYPPAALIAFANSTEAAANAAVQAVDDSITFGLRDLFAAQTKLRRQLWLARQPGVLPVELVRHFGLLVAEEIIKRLHDEGTLDDIRLRIGLAALRAVVEHRDHLRSLERPQQAVRQAMDDHGAYAAQPARAALGCDAVHAALDPDGREAGVLTASRFLQLFAKVQDKPGEEETWLRDQLLALIDRHDADIDASPTGACPL